MILLFLAVGLFSCLVTIVTGILGKSNLWYVWWTLTAFSLLGVLYGVTGAKNVCVEIPIVASYRTNDLLTLTYWHGIELTSITTSQKSLYVAADKDIAIQDAYKITTFGDKIAERITIVHRPDLNIKSEADKK